MQQASRDTTPVRTEHDTWPDAGPRQLWLLASDGRRSLVLRADLRC